MLYTVQYRNVRGVVSISPAITITNKIIFVTHDLAMISIYTLKCKLRSRDIVTDTGLLGILTKYVEFKSVINLEKILYSWRTIIKMSITKRDKK